jgi:hypothetical protein
VVVTSQYDHCDLYGLKQGDAVSPLLINCASGYAIRRVQVNWDGLKLNSTHQLLEPFKYLGRTLMHQNSIPEEIKSRWKSRNACCHLVQNLLSSILLSKNKKIKIYRTIILRVVTYGCETWSFTVREEHRLRVFENRC